MTQQAAEKATSVTKPPVVGQAKLPSPSQAGMTTAVVVVSPISGNTGGRAIVNVSVSYQLVIAVVLYSSS